MPGVALMEFRISWQICSSISSSQGVLLGNLHSWYISLYTPLISSLVDLGPMSSMADGSMLMSHSGKGYHWPWWMAQSCSFLLMFTACKNILYRRNRKWNPQGSHCGYSSRKVSLLSHLSAPCMDMPSSFASFLAAAIFTIQLLISS